MGRRRLARRRAKVGHARRHQIEQLEDRLLLVSDWQNPLLAQDVDNNGYISAGDALAVIADLRRHKMMTGQLGRDLPPLTDTQRPPPYLDVDGDNRVDPPDATRIIGILRADTLPPDILAGLFNDTAPGGTTNDDRLTFDAMISGVVTDATGDASFVPSGVASLTAQMDDAPSVPVNIDAQGQFTFDPGLPQDGTSDGDHVVRFQSRDGRGNISSFFDVQFTLDTTAPTTPTFDLDESSDTVPTGDQRTMDASVTLRGDTTPDHLVRFIEGRSATNSDGAGQFSFANLRLRNGANSFSVEASDAAGNTSTFSRQITRLLDGAIVLEEGSNFVVDATAAVELGQTAGTRTVSFDVFPTVDATDTSAAIEDILLVSLVDPNDASQTLLDRGTSGTSLFMLAGGQVDFPPGLVRFDGTTVSIDVTSLGDLTQGQLKFQLVGSDDDSGTLVQIANIQSVVDPDGIAAPQFPLGANLAAAGGALALDTFVESTDSRVIVSNVRVGSPYTAEISMRNNGPAIGRNVAVAFPGLPAGVTLQNASGVDADGAPYINLRDALPAGGLSTATTSRPVQVTFDNPNDVLFALRPTILTAGPNQAPSLDAIGPLTVTPGDRLDVPLTATDPDGDPVTFSLRGAASLPTSMLSANGRLVITPTPTQLGSYMFDVVASDGAASSSQTVTLDVLADPLTSTRISGFVLDIDQTPLAGVQVEIGAVQGLTQSDGSFTLDLGTGPLVSDTLKIRGETFGGPLVYPFIAEKLPLILEHEVFTGVNNVIHRPIFLPPLDVANGMQIDRCKTQPSPLPPSPAHPSSSPPGR